VSYGAKRLLLGDWVQAWARHFGHLPALEQELLRTAWKEVAGSVMYAQTLELRWDGGAVVYLKLSSSAAAQEVRLRQRDWLEKLVKTTGKVQIQELKVTV
jgi:hypothetical protein